MAVMTPKSRLYHIDGYKGLLCWLIMLGHYCNIYRGTKGASPLDHWLLDGVFNSFLNDAALVATFWLYAFLVISGYLLSNSRVKNVQELLGKTVIRFLRFAIPILGACCFIYLLQETVGFHANATSEYFRSEWFQKYYRKNLIPKDILLETWKALFSSSCAFNQPFWVICDMFRASVLIYVCKLTDRIYQKKVHLLPALFMLASLLMDNQVMMACFAGFMLGYYRESIEVLAENIWNFLVVALSVFFVILWLKAKNVMPDMFDKVFAYTYFHCLILIALNRIGFLKRVFSAKIFLFMGKISFGVYSFHWPVTCSIGSLVMIRAIEAHWGALAIFSCTFLASVFSTVVVSLVYCFTVERLSSWIICEVRKIFHREV